MSYGDTVNMGSSNVLLPNTEPSPEPVLTYHQ